MQDFFQARGCIEQMYVKYQTRLIAMCKGFLDIEKTNSLGRMTDGVPDPAIVCENFQPCYIKNVK